MSICLDFNYGNICTFIPQLILPMCADVSRKKSISEECRLTMPFASFSRTSECRFVEVLFLVINFKPTVNREKKIVAKVLAVTSYCNSLQREQFFTRQMSEIVRVIGHFSHRRWRVVPGRWARSSNRPLVAKRGVLLCDEELGCFRRAQLGTPSDSCY